MPDVAKSTNNAIRRLAQILRDAADVGEPEQLYIEACIDYSQRDALLSLLDWLAPPIDPASPPPDDPG